MNLILRNTFLSPDFLVIVTLNPFLESANMSSSTQPEALNNTKGKDWTAPHLSLYAI